MKKDPLFISQKIYKISEYIGFIYISNRAEIYFSSKYISQDNPYIHAISNHPVHLKNKDGNINPSALIPFCGFGGDIAIMGETMDKVDYPICNKFRPRVLQGQLCYSVDVNEIKDQIETEKLHNGLVLLIDYNRMRMLTFDNARTNQKNSTDVFDVMKLKENTQDFMIHIHTIGRTNSIYHLYLFSFALPTKCFHQLFVPAKNSCYTFVPAEINLMLFYAHLPESHIRDFMVQCDPT